ncbi:MAG: tachylectin-related carbohydrate-binding protein, partial [Bryobacteraceae bacterium]
MTGFSRLIFQDGQFPYFGEPVGANILAFGRGINVFASGAGNSAMPSRGDGQYRMAYFKPSRDEDRAYWYPAGGQAIAGGDSGGPSFSWVLSGYALVGVHSNTHADYIPGKPTTGWTWVTSISEAADAPLMPLIPSLMVIMGPVPPGPSEPALEPPPPGFIGTFSKTPPNFQPIWLYGIRPDGDLLWYRKDTNASAWQGPKTVGKGWTALKDVIAAGGNRLYGLTQDGKLMWYQHLGFNDGSFTWKPISEVGNGWTYSRIFSGGDGIVYAIRLDGKLFWYRNTGFRDGTRDWLGPKEVGSGWSGLRDVFSEGKGDVYAVKPDGTLVLYQQKDYENGSNQWSAARTVGSGWHSFQQIIPAGDGVILAIQPDGKLLWYRRQFVIPKLGRAKDVWQGPIPIGSGWQDFGKVVALI